MGGSGEVVDEASRDRQILSHYYIRSSARQALSFPAYETSTFDRGAERTEGRGAAGGE